MQSKASRTILVIDDEPIIGSIIQRFMNGDSYSILVCTSSSEAIRASRISVPEIIISDYNLPCCSNGVDLCNTIRRATGQEMPVIIISGQAENEDKARQSGFEFIGKPLRKGALLHLVETMLNRVIA